MAKKTEKIVTAIYLISQFLPKEESLKKELRQEGNSLLKDMFSLVFSSEENSQAFFLYKKCLDSTSLLISYLYVAKSTGLISKMTVDIVVEALRTLETILNRKQFSINEQDLQINEEKELENILFNKLYSKKENQNFNTSLDALTERNLNLSGNNFIKNSKEKSVDNFFPSEIKKSFNTKLDTQYTKDSSRDSSSQKEKELSVSSETESRKSYKGQKSINDKTFNSNTKAVKNTLEKLEKPEKNNTNNKTGQNKAAKNKDRKDNRRLQILGLFTKGVEVSINDISKKIIGCSIKTLQRELNDLVFEGKINKKGEKRWSKYTLV